MGKEIISVNLTQQQMEEVACESGALPKIIGQPVRDGKGREFFYPCQVEIEK